MAKRLAKPDYTKKENKPAVKMKEAEELTQKREEARKMAQEKAGPGRLPVSRRLRKGWLPRLQR